MGEPALSLASESVPEWGLVTGKWVNYSNKHLTRKLENGRIYVFTSIPRKYPPVLIETFLGSNGEEMPYPFAITVERFDFKDIQDMEGLAELVLQRARTYNIKDQVRKLYDDSGKIDSVSVYPFVMTTEEYRDVINLAKFQDDSFRRLESLVQKGKR